MKSIIILNPAGACALPAAADLTTGGNPLLLSCDKPDRLEFDTRPDVSGPAGWYRETIGLTAEQASKATTLAPGNVVPSAELHVNSKLVGIKTAPPRTFDLTCQLKPGENRMGDLVCNTPAIP